jgi:hypothetical protein
MEAGAKSDGKRLGALKVPVARALTWPVMAAIVVNLVPVIGVLFWGWSAFALIFLYWLENVVIGVRTLASMIANAVVLGGVSWLGALFFGAFFTVHYGMFCFGHGVFVMALFGGNAFGDSILDLAGATQALLMRETNLLIGLGSIVAWQLVQFVLFLTRGEVRRTNVTELMGAPYPRIIVLHITIIAGGFVLLLLNQPLAGLLMLALIKMAFDVAEIMRNEQPKPANEA